MTAAAEVLTQNQLAEALGVDRKTLNDWKRNDSAPIEQALAMPLNEAIEFLSKWRQQNKRPRYWSEGDADANGTLQEQLIAAQIRKHNADALARELKNAEAQGRLVDRDIIIDELAELLSKAKPMLESMVDDIAKESREDSRVVNRQIAKNAADRFFRTLAAWKPESNTDGS